MIERKDIEKLASLARIKISPEEADVFKGEIESILDYVAQVQKVSLPKQDDRKSGLVRNVLREDSDPHESGINTEVLLNESPEREGQYVKVKNIL
ncbi:MAG: hypothetical protein RJA61_622 [Candidatus Parcubacteria bacterium]|jgi:aspartyl-tRNA(Asn)/glutamyl-tRNA(Gln) amidotransferase subunit C